MQEIAETSSSAVGRKYGVSDNAIRKWVRTYERGFEKERRRVRPWTLHPGRPRRWRGLVVSPRKPEAALALMH